MKGQAPPKYRAYNNVMTGQPYRTCLGCWVWVWSVGN